MNQPTEVPMAPGNILARVSAYYSDKVRQFGATAAGVDWKDQRSQDLRFAQLATVMRDNRSGSMAEVGCGWGAFAAWAHAQQCDLHYIGYDISPEMLETARKTVGHLPNVGFRLGAVPSERADFVIASGIFNVRFDIPDEAWRVYVDDTIDSMAQAAIKGFAFNCLTGFSDDNRKEGRLFYPYPGEMFDRCLHRYGRHAVLLHDYGLYEFTIVVWNAN
jgi:hypothetical protein